MDADASICDVCTRRVTVWHIRFVMDVPDAKRVAHRLGSRAPPVAIARGGLLTLRAALGVSRALQGNALQTVLRYMGQTHLGGPLIWSWRLGIGIKCSGQLQLALLACAVLDRACIRMGELVGAGHRVVSCVQVATVEAGLSWRGQRHKRFLGCRIAGL